MKARNTQSLRFAEAFAIRAIKPDLCVQKGFAVHIASPRRITVQHKID